MQTFIFIYRNPARYAPAPETSVGMKAWFGGMGKRLAELGEPVVASELSSPNVPSDRG